MKSNEVTLFKALTPHKCWSRLFVAKRGVQMIKKAQLFEENIKLKRKLFIFENIGIGTYATIKEKDILCYQNVTLFPMSLLSNFSTMHTMPLKMQVKFVRLQKTFVHSFKKYLLYRILATCKYWQNKLDNSPKHVIYKAFWRIIP